VRPEDDRVVRLIEYANGLLDGASGVQALADELLALPGRELVRFDQQSRSWHRGLRQLPRPEQGALWEITGLVARDGQVREHAVRATELSPLTVRLLALRATDWAGPVRTAALERVEAAPPELLIGALALVDQLVAERLRAAGLDAVVDGRLNVAELRTAIRAEHAPTRRAAWRRLALRDAATGEDVALAARDPDPVVRGLAGRRLGRLPADERRAIAEVMIDDPVGWVARQALECLVALDGAAAISRALTARGATLRRAARDWAAIRDVDARGVYLERVDRQPRDAIALTALCELADPRDADRFREALGDPRTRIRAGALRALGRVDRPAARAAAMRALESDASGRVQRTAADVLRDGGLSTDETRRLQRVALDGAVAPGLRFRALALLRPERWTQLAVLLERRAEEPEHELLDDELRRWLHASVHMGRGPEPALRDRVTRLLPALDEQSRTRIEFIFRTT
jgi:hypothetical protein